MLKHKGSFAVGALSAALLVATVAAIERSPAPTSGRFQIGCCQHGGNSSDAFVLDTATGQVWRDSQSNFYDPKATATQP